MHACDGRFTDAWVVDRTLFEHVNQGSCSCCGNVHAMMDIAATMSSCSDIETDDGKNEHKSSWPKMMVAEVWADRVKLRKAMKAEMLELESWWSQWSVRFTAWWASLDTSQKTRLMQFPVDEVMTIVVSVYDIRGAYTTVLCAVNEQLKNFAATNIKNDGRTPAELAFETALETKRGAFILPENYLCSSGFVDMCERIGSGGKLLPRAPSASANSAHITSNNNSSSSSSSANKSSHEESDEGMCTVRSQSFDEEVQSAFTENSELRSSFVHRTQSSSSPFHDGLNDAADDGTGSDDSGGQQSFRADRRLLRLIIAREFFKAARTRFMALPEQQQEQQQQQQ